MHPLTYTHIARMYIYTCTIHHKHMHIHIHIRIHIYTYTPTLTGTLSLTLLRRSDERVISRLDELEEFSFTPDMSASSSTHGWYVVVVVVVVLCVCVCVCVWCVKGEEEGEERRVIMLGSGR